MKNNLKTSFTYGNFVVENVDVDGTVATFTGPGAGSAGKQYIDWLTHTPGTELEDLRVAIKEIDGALCNYCNQVGDPYDPPSHWDKTCKHAFQRLCEAYNAWHRNHDIVGELSQKFWGRFDAELYYTKQKLNEAERRIAQLEADNKKLLKKDV